MQPICASTSVPRGRVLLFVASQAMAMALAMLAALSCCLGWREGLAYSANHYVTLVTSSGILVAAFGVAGLYEASGPLQRPRKTLAAASVAVLVGTPLVTALLWTTSSWEVGLRILLVFAVLALFAVFTVSLIHRWTQRLGFMTSRCLMIGANGEARKAIDLIRRHPHAGLKVVGVVHCGKDRGVVGTLIDDHPVLGTDASLTSLVRLHRIERLIVAAPIEIEAALSRHLRSFRYRGLALGDYVTLHEELTQEISLEHINDEWLLAAAMNNSRLHIRRFKRAVDVVAALGGLVLAAPIAAVIALLIKLDSFGSVLYRQERLGRDGVPFTMLKFRTMTTDAENRTGPVWAMEGDPRITRVGRWLRSFRIDEVPQLINVLRGQMSLVGPRPEREAFVTRLAKEIPFYAERFMVHPGITGWAQVMQSYAASIEESRRKLQADLYYIKHMSFLTDMYIVLKTVKIVLFGRERSRSVEVHASEPPGGGLVAHR